MNDLMTLWDCRQFAAVKALALTRWHIHLVAASITALGLGYALVCVYGLVAWGKAQIAVARGSKSLKKKNDTHHVNGLADHSKHETRLCVRLR